MNGTNLHETVYLPGQIQEMIPYLRDENERGLDVYLTPVDLKHHYIVIAEMNPTGLANLTTAGFHPCLVQSTGVKSLTATIRLGCVERDDELKLVRRLTWELNQIFGDPEFNNAFALLPMAGFRFANPGANKAVASVVDAPGDVCFHSGRLLEMMRNEVDDMLRPADVFPG